MQFHHTALHRFRTTIIFISLLGCAPSTLFADPIASEQQLCCRTPGVTGMNSGYCRSTSQGCNAGDSWTVTYDAFNCSQNCGAAVVPVETPIVEACCERHDGSFIHYCASTKDLADVQAYCGNDAVIAFWPAEYCHSNCRTASGYFPLIPAVKTPEPALDAPSRIVFQDPTQDVLETIYGISINICAEPYSAYHNCTNFAQDFHKKAEQYGINTLSVTLYCDNPDVGHLLNLVQVPGIGYCFVDTTKDVLDIMAGGCIGGATPGDITPTAMCAAMGRPLQADGSCSCHVGPISPTPLTPNTNPITQCGMNSAYHTRAECGACCDHIVKGKDMQMYDYTRWYNDCQAGCDAAFNSSPGFTPLPIPASPTAAPPSPPTTARPSTPQGPTSNLSNVPSTTMPKAPVAGGMPSTTIPTTASSATVPISPYSIPQRF